MLQSSARTAGGSGGRGLEPPRLQMAPESLYDRRGFYRSPITYGSYRVGQEPANKGKTYPPEPLTQREVLALIAACGKGNAGLRNRAMIVVMWRGGLRVSEMLALEPKDVDLEKGIVRVLHGKFNQYRSVGLDPTACAVIEKWIQARRKLNVPRGSRLFCVISKPTVGLDVSAQYVRGMLKTAAQRAGIEKRVHPHGLRHTHAFELAEEDTDLRDTQIQLGHKDLATTARYVNHVNPHRTVQRMRGRAWPDPAIVPATGPEIPLA